MAGNRRHAGGIASAAQNFKSIQERAAFEEWARDSGNGGDLKYYAPRDQYLNLYTHGMWEAWKARAAVGVPLLDGGQQK